MKKPVPKFISSPYFIMKPGKWKLKPGAPKDIIEEFEQYMDIKRR